MDTRTKVVSAAQITRKGILAWGRFDVLTAEHCRLLADARKQAPRLTALVTADPAERPTLLDAKARAHLAAALGSVDCVIICDQSEREQLLDDWDPTLVLDVESQVRRDVVADVLSRHAKT